MILPIDGCSQALIAGVTLLGAGIVWVIRDGRENERHKRERLAHRFCVLCGYNLSGSVGRCPECGTVIRRRGEE